MSDQIQINFEAFHAENPHVYGLFCKFTGQMLSRGLKHGGAQLIIERIRWETTVVTTSFPPVKINNNYGGRYARLWMHEHPHYKGFFRTRELLASSVDSILKVDSPLYALQ